MNSRGLAARAGAWSARHRGLAIVLWACFALSSVAVGTAVGTRTLGSDKGGAGSSGQADAVLQAQFPQPAQEVVLVQAPAGPESRLERARLKAAVADVMARLEPVSVVKDLRSPYAPGEQGQVSADGRSVLVSFDVRGSADSADQRIAPALSAVAGAQRAHPAFRIAEFGDASANRAVQSALSGDLQRAETISVPLTLLILVAVFGALVAASVPILLAISAVAATLGLVALPSQLVAFDGSASSVIVLIGMAVGIDYALFYIRREREERRGGASPDEALARAARTSGRAVLVSGTTVIIAMAGMLLTGDATFTSFAIGTMIVVAVAMVGSVTFLPAMLALLGDRIDSGRVPLLGRRQPAGRSVWSSLLRPVLRRPRTAAVVTTALLLACATPALGMHLLLPGVRSIPASLPVMKTYARIQKAFPGAPTPALVVVQAPDASARPVRAAIASLETRALASGQVGGPMSVNFNRARTVAVVQMSLAGDGTDRASYRALATLRRLTDATLGRLGGRVSTNITGTAAETSDFNALLSARTPLVFAFVLTLAFLLLLVTFRSIVIPITAIVLNLLSVGAAYGAMTLVFQRHWAQGLLSFQDIGGITSWLPLFMFVILFGLSMDYHVFILSRIKEAHERGLPTRDAIAHGIGATGGVVTSAAAVMVAVFAIFATLSVLELKQLGVGLAVAIALDATIIRGVLLPATMTILGEANWYLPSPLRRWLAHHPAGASVGSPDRDELHDAAGVRVKRRPQRQPA